MDAEPRATHRDEDEQERDRARRSSIPDAFASDHHRDDLAAWMQAAEPGSAEHLLLALLLTAWDHEPGAATVLAPAIWDAFRARVDPTRHRRSTDVEHRLPFPLSEGLLALARFGDFAEDAEARQRAATMGVQMLECFPDEHPRVRCRIECFVASARLLEGHERAHRSFERLLREHPRDPLPIVEYVAAMARRAAKADREEKLALMRRVVDLLEPALEERPLAEAMDVELGWPIHEELERARTELEHAEAYAEMVRACEAERAAREAGEGHHAEPPDDHDARSPYRSHEDWREESKRQPECNAIDHGATSLLEWLRQAEPGSIEQRLLAVIVAVSDLHEPDAAAVFASDVWALLRARLDPALHRRSDDVEHRLPFPLSQALVALAFPGFLSNEPGVLDLAATMVGEMLSSFPDEDPRVVRTLASHRVRMRVGAGHEDGHDEAERIIAAHPDHSDPVDAYVKGLETRHRRAAADEQRILLRRTIDVLESALTKDLRVEPGHEWFPEDDLDRAYGRLEALDEGDG